MKIHRIFCILISAFIFSGCGMIYKQNIQQGNSIEQDDLDELYEGMNQRQVLFVLGTPSVKDPFHPDRWDYVQTFSRRGGEMMIRTVTLRFEDGLLAEIVGQSDPFAATSGQSTGSGTLASFVKPAGSQASADADAEPESVQDATIKTAEEEILGADPDIETIEERTSEDREYQRDMDVLDQTPGDGVSSPDIDG